MEVLLLEIEDPGCFWVTIEACRPGMVDEIEYKNLDAEMNRFYDKSYEDRSELKPLTVKKGQVYVVFSEELKRWCRATVTQSVMCCTDDYLTECFLVDYAKYIFVKSENIRVALKAFMQIPCRAKKCRLYRTKPVTLHIDFCAGATKIVSANRWDSAAIQYFQNLLKAATRMKAKLCAVEENTCDVFLYVTTKDGKVCVNDDLVLKNFARFEEANDNTGSSADYQGNQTSLDFESLPVKSVNPALASRPMLFNEKVSTNLETGSAASRIFPEKTYQRSSTGLNEYTEPIVKAIPSLAFNKNTAVHTGRLQQHLNSDPLKTRIIEDHQQSFQNLIEEKNFVFLSDKIAPSSTLETAPILDELREELAQKNFSGPSFTESYCWPPVARGCDVVAISCQGNDPLLYIPPLLTFLLLGNCYQPLPKRNGPLALILCPGWKKAELVFGLLKTYKRWSRLLHPELIILGQKKEAGSLKIRGCGIIVTTPYSLLRLLEHRSLFFSALCHLVLDEVEVLFSDAAEQVFTILECYKKAICTGDWEYSLHQTIAVGTRWNKHTARLIKEFMNNPYIVITTVEEASIYGNVQQVLQPCRDSEKTAVLLKILDFTHNDLQKVLVFTSSVNEAVMVHKALTSNSISSLKVHAESKFDFNCILEQWTRGYSSGTHVVLDDCMQYLGITDATCVVHFSFPSPRVLGQRLRSMSDNFCNVIKDSSVDGEYPRARSVFLLTEDSACHALEILHFLQHAEAEIPQELYDFTAKTVEAEEHKKFSRPLCAYLKIFGICKNRTVCPDRHQVNMQIDVPQNIPDKVKETPGYVTILPLHIVNATNYFGRIVDQEKDQYTILAEEINEYFKEPRNKNGVQTVEKLAFYGLCEKRLFHRVQVVEISPKEEENLSCNVKIKFIDEGRTSQVQSSQLLHLPARFQCLPPQAVEFIVCRVKPIDNETEWNPEVTSYINYKIKGKLHEAKIIHTLGNTAWVDPMVRVNRLAYLKLSVNEYNVRSEILATGLGTDNPEHVTQLQKLCGCVNIPDHEKNLEPLSLKEDAAGLENVSSLQNMSIQENSTETCSSPKIVSGNQLCDDVAQSKEAEDSTLHQHKCLYPEIKWFQSEESLTVKVKIVGVADWKCEFSKEKVLFSASSGGKWYLADMELHKYILAAKSVCVIKDREAVIVLVKEKKGAWSRLLKNKNPQVSYDFEHWEDFEDKSPFPVVLGTKKLHHAPAGDEEFTDSSEDSGTESDE